MLIARFRDRETADAEAYLELLVEPAQGVPLEPKLLELLRTALLENMRGFLAFLSHDIDITKVAAPLMTLEYVRRLAQNGIGVSGVTTALRTMQKRLLGLLISEIRQSRLTRETALEVFDLFVDRSFGYVDRIT